MCACVNLLMHAHGAAQMLCMTSCVTKMRYMIVCCQGDIAGELELLTHGHTVTVCQVTAWTI